MPLQDKLDAIRNGFEPQVPTDTLAIMHRATADLAASGQADRAIKSGDLLPGFALKNQDGETVSSAELLAKGPLVISFFRGVWCPYCNAELKALSQATDAIRAEGAEIVAISPQTSDYAVKTQSTNKLKMDVLVDDAGAYSATLGLQFSLPEDLRSVYSGFGIDLPTHNGEDDWRLPMAARYVVGQDGTILHSDINADYTRRPDPSETIEVIKAAARKAA